MPPIDTPSVADWIGTAPITATGILVGVISLLLRGVLVTGIAHKEIVEVYKEENRLLRTERDDLRKRIWPTITTADRALEVATKARRTGRSE